MFKAIGKWYVAVLAMGLTAGILLGVAATVQANTPAIPALTKSAVFTIGLKTVTVDGQVYQMDVAPYIDANGRTMVPVRYLADVLGAYAVNWDGKDQIVDLGFDNPGHVDLTIGEPEIGYNGSEDPMDTAPVIVPPGRTMLPARFVAQAVGDTVTWDAASQTVTVTSSDNANGLNGVVPSGTMTNGGGGNTVPGGHITPVH
ncbi:MAG: copper amine oxidase N-terminal domain-containing protein [Peptococcaceae bacterium]|jgi:hypothetical protein|nr:copper amine oxidase N-terminal domain-containing protein [Peptococcaceae bacterium]